MTERELIVHSDVAENILREKNPGDRYYSTLQSHVSVIREVRQQPGTVELTEDDSPRNAGERFEEGDKVTVYGLWRESCVNAAKESLEDNGITFKDGDEPNSILP